MQHISLTDLNLLIKDTLNTQLEPSYWVVAEIGELREARNEHCYIEFVEKDEEAGVKLIACGFSMKKFGVEAKDIPSEFKIVENGILYNFQLQKKGYYSLGL